MEERERALRWYEKLAAETNEIFLPLYWDAHRYLVLKGSAGSGKSIFAGRKILERCSAEPGHRVLVCRKVKNTLKESCYAQLVSQAEAAGMAFRATVSPMRMDFPSGSCILFVGLDDVMKLKSVYEITDVWIEEAAEITETDFRQMDIRMRGRSGSYQQMILTFNPVSVLHWLRRRFWERRDPKARLHESTYRDNRWLPAENAAVLESFRDSDPYYYTVYCLGEWGVTGQSVFSAAEITAQLQRKIEPLRRVWFTYTDDGRRLSEMTAQEGDLIAIYAEPEPGVPYVMGVDTAGDGSDMNVAQVLDNRTGALVATLRGKLDEDELARQIMCLGYFYNTALIAVETNLTTYPVRELERCGYPRQYLRESVEEITHRVRLVHGFRTDSKTRPLAVATLVKAVREDPTLVPDAVTLGEMLTFVRSESFRPEAQPGAHDDCVMALAIAHMARNQQEIRAKKDPGEKAVWTPSMWADWRRAAGEEKELLIAKWGDPR